MISKAESNVLKAISIMVIVLNHFGAWIYKPKDIVLMLSGSFCQAAVGMFLFLSGYGIMFSYQQNGIKNYWKKRFRKIYIPFLIISTMEFFMKLWQYRNNIGDMYINR